MNSLSKNKLKQIESILEKYLIYFQDIDSSKNGNSNSLVYSNGLSSLIKKSNLDKFVNKSNFIKNAKIVRAAKNLIINFEDLALTSYSNLVDKTINDVFNLNGISKLAPNMNKVINKINSNIFNYELLCESYYDTLLIDIFNQGRQHQTLTKNVSFKKLASLAKEDLEIKNDFDNVLSILKNQTAKFCNDLKLKSQKLIESNYNKSFSKQELLSQLEKDLSLNSFNIQELFRTHCLKLYSFGNLYQLKKDNINYVSWKTSQCIDDCIDCRAFQTGDKILQDNDGNQLNYIKKIDSALYDINDIIKISNIEGPSYFCHNNCRCQFVEGK